MIFIESKSFWSLAGNISLNLPSYKLKFISKKAETFICQLHIQSAYISIYYCVCPLNYARNDFQSRNYSLDSFLLSFMSNYLTSPVTVISPSTKGGNFLHAIFFNRSLVKWLTAQKNIFRVFFGKKIYDNIYSNELKSAFN